ncbi:MAG: twitching motility protein [Parcubacteria group bacterium GW2011_GWA2_42_11]|nr:MAG: twitching motility protein [Parcubacteria group bacterium GW2011_GWA2_42_11]
MLYDFVDYKKEIDQIIEEAIRVDATDIHLTPGRPPIVRVNGSLTMMENQGIIDAEKIKNLASSLLTPEQEKRLSETKDIDLSFTFRDISRFRANIYNISGGLAVALRFLPTKIRNIEELHLPEILNQFSMMSQGFFLVVGPSGHGKSTALAAMIDSINHHRQDHIITIEDPIEYVFEQDKCIIEQREVGTDVSGFNHGLRSMFREDADVVMIGEMRDKETISTAITAAETGHLIFSTLHTNTASQTVDRIIDSFPPYQQEQIRAQLASNLLGVLSRRLLPDLQGGMINAIELLIANSAIRNLIREGKTHQIDMVLDTSSEEGMISLNHSLSNLVQEGKVSLEVAEKFSLNPAELRMLLR